MIENTIEQKNKKKGLGRGLGTLLGGPEERSESPSGLKSPAAVSENKPSVLAKPVKTENEVAPTSTSLDPSTESTRVWSVSIEKIRPGRYQPRKNFDKASLEELAQSIKQNGILQPIVVRKGAEDGFEIVAGERRWRAAQIAMLQEVPVIIKNFDNKRTLQLALIENIQRENLNPIEEGEAYFKLTHEFGLSQSEVAEKVGKDRTTVTNLVRLLGLPKEVKELLKTNEITLGHAKVLLSINSPEEQIKWARLCQQDKISVRKLEKEIQLLAQRKVMEEKPQSSKNQITSQLVSQLTEDLQKSFGTKVQIDYTQGRGKISLNFYSDEELSNLVEKLKEACKI